MSNTTTTAIADSIAAAESFIGSNPLPLGVEPKGDCLVLQYLQHAEWAGLSMEDCEPILVPLGVRVLRYRDGGPRKFIYGTTPGGARRFVASRHETAYDVGRGFHVHY